MAVFLFKGGYEIVKKSGVGKAIQHQESILNRLGVPVVDNWKEASAIIHLNTVFPDSFFAAIRAKRSGKKVIYYGHSTMEDFRNSFHGSNLFAPFFKFWIKRCYNRGDIIITPSPYSKRILETYKLKKPIYAISNGINTDFFHFKEEYGLNFREKYQLKQEDKVVISVGHYIKRKGVLDFIEMAKRNPEVKFIWFGFTNLKMVPKEISYAVTNPPKNLLFAGFVSKDELRDAYCGADCFMFLSHEETEGIVVLEALACQINTIVRDIDVYNPWLIDNKNVLKGSNIDEFQNHLDRIINDEVDLREGAKELADSRSLTTIADQLYQVYIDLGCSDAEVSL